MENINWKPQNKSQYLNGRDKSVWSMCPEDKLPQLKKEYDKKRFGWRKVEGKFYHSRRTKFLVGWHKTSTTINELYQLNKIVPDFNKRFFIVGETEAGGPVMQPQHDPENAEVAIKYIISFCKSNIFVK